MPVVLDRIHLLLLSLAIRGAGVYFLIHAAISLDHCLGFVVFPGSTTNTILYTEVYAAYFVIKLGLAIYFFLGAPPALKWVQRPRVHAPDPALQANLPPIPADKGMTSGHPGDKLD
jgi:hypothetical protein